MSKTIIKDPYWLIHLLTGVAVSSINRGQDGRPKTMKLNDTNRGYSSSQNRKYDLNKALFERCEIDIGLQTPLIGKYVEKRLIDGGISPKKAEEYAFKFIGTFVDIKKHTEKEDDKNTKKKKKKVDLLKTETIKIQPSERQHIEELIDKIIEGHKPTDQEFFFLKENTGIRTALTGRMIAKLPQYDVEASLSSNFAFTVNDIGSVQTDYFTATDNLGLEGTKGSGHLDNFYFTQGVYYSFFVINSKLLTKNLQGNKELAIKTIRQIVEVLTTSSPSANKNRCADSQTWPAFVMIEKAPTAPRSLCQAFHTPIKGPAVMENAVKALLDMKSSFDSCYHEMDYRILNVLTKEGSLNELIKFIDF